MAGLAVLLSSVSTTAFAQATGPNGGTLTGTTAWNTPPATIPASAAPVPTPLATPSSAGLAVDTAFRMQAGWSGGLLVEAGPSLALTAAAMRGRLRAEVGGRYHAPRTVAIPTFTLGSFARLSLFELDIRGCLVLDPGPIEIPLCLGVSSGRWKADPVGVGSADPTADTWVGGHVLFSGRYEVDSNLAFWAGAQGTMSIVQPHLGTRMNPDVVLLQAGRYASALEAGVEVKFN